MNAVAPRCPDPRGPLVDREDFIEGQIDALEEIERKFRAEFDDLMHHSDTAEVRLGLDPSFSGNSPVEQYAADMDVSACIVKAAIRDALNNARWKLARIRKGGAL